MKTENLTPDININKDSEILAVAGEVSGDILGAEILKPLLKNTNLNNPKNISKNISLTGIGGTHLQKIGQQQFYNCHELAVRGYIEALPALFKILKIRSFLKKYLQKNPPKIYMGIDAADFNLHIEQYAPKNTKVVHVISPSIWAWRAERLQKIKKVVDYMFCIFPFEVDLYEKAGVPAIFIGHPLANQIPLKLNNLNNHSLNNLATQIQIQTKTAITLLPGSRVHEIKTLLPIFLDVAVKLIHQGITAVYLPVASMHVKHLIQTIIENHPESQTLQKHLQLTQNMHDALIFSQAALVASGTASLEVALYGTPMIIAYQVPKITAFLMQRQALINCVGLPNILYQKLIQKNTLNNFNDFNKFNNYICIPEHLQNLDVDVLVKQMQDLLLNREIIVTARHLPQLKGQHQPMRQAINASQQRAIFLDIHQQLRTKTAIKVENYFIEVDTGLEQAQKILENLMN